jgi:MinD superfamily P-loop ATPase
MQSKNKKAPTAAEKRHIERVKALPCSVCDDTGPSDCHEIKQGQWFTSVALCQSCHTGSLMGLHGQRRAWAIRKLDELDALARTVERLLA